MGRAAGFVGLANVAEFHILVRTPSALQHGRAKELGVLWSSCSTVCMAPQWDCDLRVKVVGDNASAGDHRWNSRRAGMFLQTNLFTHGETRRYIQAASGGRHYAKGFPARFPISRDVGEQGRQIRPHKARDAAFLYFCQAGTNLNPNREARFQS